MDLPQNIGLAGTHRFEAIFEDWEIKSLEMNGLKLVEKRASEMSDTKLNVKEGSINFWIEKQKLEFADNKMSLESYRFKALAILELETHQFTFGAEYRIVNLQNRVNESLREESFDVIVSKPIEQFADNEYQPNSL